MVLLHDAVNAKKLDVRLVERNVNRGSVTNDELNKSVSSLPDDSENADYVAIDSFKDDDSESDSE